MEKEIENWIKEHIYLDDETGERRDIILDIHRERLFFFADPLDFDKDDTFKPARYWLDEIEDWKPEWHDFINRHYAK